MSVVKPRQLLQDQTSSRRSGALPFDPYDFAGRATLDPALALAQRANKKRRVKARHAKIANRRKDALHKLCTELVNKLRRDLHRQRECIGPRENTNDEIHAGRRLERIPNHAAVQMRLRRRVVRRNR